MFGRKQAKAFEAKCDTEGQAHFEAQDEIDRQHGWFIANIEPTIE